LLHFRCPSMFAIAFFMLQLDGRLWWWDGGRVRGVRLARLGMDKSTHMIVVFLLYAGVERESLSVGTSWWGVDVLGVSEVRGGADPVLVGVGTSSLRGERMKGGPPCGRVGWRWTSFILFYFLCVVRVGSSVSGRVAGVGCPDANTTVLLLYISVQKMNPVFWQMFLSLDLLYFRKQWPLSSSNLVHTAIIFVWSSSSRF